MHEQALFTCLHAHHVHMYALYYFIVHPLEPYIEPYQQLTMVVYIPMLSLSTLTVMQSK